MPFVLGYLWVFLVSLCLYAAESNSTIWCYSFLVNMGLNTMYLALFFMPYRKKQKDIQKEILLLITLQMLSFLFLVVILWYLHVPLIFLLWIFATFLGVLALQVREQILFLKSI